MGRRCLELAGRKLDHTFPIVSARGTKHNIMIVSSKSSSNTLLTGTKVLMASWTTSTKTPHSIIRIILNSEILAQHIAPSIDIPGFLLCVYIQPFFIAMCTCLQDTRDNKWCFLYVCMQINKDWSPQAILHASKAVNLLGDSFMLQGRENPVFPTGNICKKLGFCGRKS